MIFNPKACRFDPKQLVYSGAKTESCLSMAQAEALAKAFAGPKDSRGRQVYDVGMGVDAAVDRALGDPAECLRQHCGGGPETLDSFDALSAIVKWVEQGQAPERITATGRAFPGRSRPLCAYPMHAHYKGQGDPESAENFECRP
jgi:Tannase and feruloyl esterase